MFASGMHREIFGAYKVTHSQGGYCVQARIHVPYIKNAYPDLTPGKTLGIEIGINDLDLKADEEKYTQHKLFKNSNANKFPLLFGRFILTGKKNNSNIWGNLHKKSQGKFFLISDTKEKSVNLGAFPCKSGEKYALTCWAKADSYKKQSYSAKGVRLQSHQQEGKKHGRNDDINFPEGTYNWKYFYKVFDITKGTNSFSFAIKQSPGMKGKVWLKKISAQKLAK